MTTFACTKVDANFGNNLIPPGELMGTRIDSTVQIETSIIALDSVLTSSTKIGLRSVGSYIDPLVGRVDISTFMSYCPEGFEDAVKGFGKDPVVDSMKLYLDFATYLGDTLTNTLNIELYEVKGKVFSRNSSYYSNFDMKPYLVDTPLVKFQMRAPGIYAVNLPKDFAKRFIMDTSKENNPYTVDTLFHEVFNGFFIKSNNFKTGEGLMLGVDLLSSGMNLFYHNNNSPKKDTTTQSFTFVNEYAPYNVSFEIAKSDYSLSNQAAGGVNPVLVGDTTIQTEFGYIQGVGGLGTSININKNDIERLKAKVKSEGYSTIAIHSAELIVDLVNPQWQNYEKSFLDLGLYVSLMGGKFIPDYNPTDKIYGIDPKFGGALNRSLGQYHMNITRHVQDLILRRSSDYRLELLSDYSIMMGLARSQVYGSKSNKPPKLVLTYTMIK